MQKGSQKVNVSINLIINEIRKGKTLTQIGKSLGIHRVSVSDYLKKYNLSKESVKFNHNFFKYIDSEEKAYWLGFLMADGCVSLLPSPKIVVKLANIDFNHLKKWHKSLNSSVNICRTTLAIQSQHYSNNLCNDLIKFGCTPAKSKTLKFPNLATKFVNHFVRGYFDGDGYIGKTNKNQLKVSFAGTYEFLSSLKEILNIKNKLLKTGKCEFTFVLEIHGNIKAKKIANWMYQESTIFLDRKKEVYYSTI